MLLLLFVVLVFGGQTQKFAGSVLGASDDITPQVLLNETNQERASRKAPQLSIHPALNQAAAAKARDMATNNYWSHRTPSGEEPWIFIDNADYAYQSAGENLAYGFSNSSAVIDGWMQSESHKLNMLDPEYSNVGFGVARSNDFNEQGPATIIVAFYATPEAAPSTKDKNPGLSYSTNPQTIAHIETIAGSFAPQAVISATAILALAAGFLIARHAVRLKKIAVEGEHFVMHHPVLDIGLTLVIVLGVLLMSSSGTIG